MTQMAGNQKKMLTLVKHYGNAIFKTTRPRWSLASGWSSSSVMLLVCACSVEGRVQLGPSFGKAFGSLMRRVTTALPHLGSKMCSSTKRHEVQPETATVRTQRNRVRAKLRRAVDGSRNPLDFSHVLSGTYRRSRNFGKRPRVASQWVASLHVGAWLTQPWLSLKTDWYELEDFSVWKARQKAVLIPGRGIVDGRDSPVTPDGIIQRGTAHTEWSLYLPKSTPETPSLNPCGGILLERRADPPMMPSSPHPPWRTQVASGDGEEHVPRCWRSKAFSRLTSDLWKRGCPGLALTWSRDHHAGRLSFRHGWNGDLQRVPGLTGGGKMNSTNTHWWWRRVPRTAQEGGVGGARKMM